MPSRNQHGCILEASFRSAYQWQGGELFQVLNSAQASVNLDIFVKLAVYLCCTMCVCVCV